jgi:type I restriction enzyme S subunit
MKKGWKILSFGELGRVFNGNSISEAEKKAHFEGIDYGVPYIGTKDVSFEHEVAYESGVKIPDDRRDDFKLAPANTVLVCAEGGSAGRKIAHTDREIYFGNKLFAICPSPPISSRLIFYYCLSDDFTKQFKGSMAGLIGGVSINKFKELSVPVPPLAEQQRIVGLLDEAFEGLATAKANAEKNLQNARALFESHLQSVFTQRGPGWVEKRLDEACEIIMGQSPDGETYNTTGEGVPLINGPVEFSPDSFGKTVRSKFTTKPTKLCKKDDLILCVRGSTTGRMNISGFDACVGRGVAAIRAREYQPWINHFINAKREEIYRLGTGATFPNVSGAVLGGLKLSVPALATQKEIVSKLDDLREETQRLAHLYERKHAALEALKKSLLHQAFSGEL